MNITLSPKQRFALAMEFGQQIHSTLICLHLRAIRRHDGRPDDGMWATFADSRREVRAAIASIPSAERRVFIGDVRYAFFRIREKNGTEPTSRGYVAAVLDRRGQDVRRAA